MVADQHRASATRRPAEPAGHPYPSSPSSGRRRCPRTSGEDAAGRYYSARSADGRHSHAMATTMQLAEASRDRLRALGRPRRDARGHARRGPRRARARAVLGCGRGGAGATPDHVGRRAGRTDGCRGGRAALARRSVTPSAGDIFLADTHDQQRRRVLVVSDTRFHQATARAIVAPSIATVVGDESPWRPGVDERFAVDFLTTLPVDRLREAVGRVDAATLRQRAASRRAVALTQIWSRRWKCLPI